MRAGRATCFALVAGYLLLECVPAYTQETDSARNKFYVGAGIGIGDLTGRFNSVQYSDSPAATLLYGGFRISDDWSIEISYLDLDTSDSGIIAGSGTRQLRLQDDYQASSVRALRQINLSELFRWNPDIRLFGTLGLSKWNRKSTALDLSVNEFSTFESTDAGITAGFGATHHRKLFAVRGYVQWINILEDDNVTDIGIAIQFEF